MEISKLKIKNFRSIKSAEIAFCPIIAVVGKNNAGKSAILKALNCFFNPEMEREAFESGVHHHTNNATPAIEILFSKISTSSPIPHSSKSESVWIRFQWKGSEPVYSFKRQTKYHQLTKSQLTSLKSSVAFRLVPPVREYQRLNRFENNLLKEIIVAFLAKKQRNTISPKLKVVGTQVRKTLGEIEKKVKANYLLEKGLDFALAYDDSEENTHNFMSDFRLRIIEKGIEFRPEECGTGVQSLLIIGLYKYLSDLTHKNYLIGIEEPEANLHPQSQRHLIRRLKELVDKKDISVVMTTHSPSIVDSLDHTEIALCRKTYNQNNRCLTSIHQLQDNYWAVNKLQKHKYDTFFKYLNSEFFFADKVIICEGRSDERVIQMIANDNDVDLLEKNISILRLDGIKNLNYPYSLVTELGMEHLIVIDKDFFFQYKNGSLASSRDSKGFPQYKTDYNSTNLTLIQKMIPGPTKRDTLKKEFKSNHATALKTLSTYNIICFRYNLETDLCNSKLGLQEYGKTFKIGAGKDLNEEVLVKRCEAMKDLNRIEAVYKSLDNRNFPYSYSKIKNLLKKM